MTKGRLILRRIVELRYPIFLITIFLLMIIMPSFFPSESKSNISYVSSVKGVLSTDTYKQYPYAAKDLEIGFSRWGEIVTPNGRGLYYDGHEAFAVTEADDRYLPFEGWLLNYSYQSRPENKTESGLAYALFSDLSNKSYETGRTTNLLPEPIQVLYDGPRRFIAKTIVHIFQSHVNVINLKQTISFNKVSKIVVVLMDIEFLKSFDSAGALSVEVSRRVSFRLTHDLTRRQGRTDEVYTRLLRGIKTPYRYENWPGHELDGFYDVAVTYVTSQQTEGPEYSGFAAYWPNVTASRLYGEDYWNKVIQGHETPSYDPKPALLIGQWNATILPESSGRFVVAYGIVDGTPIGNNELQFQFDMIFDPQDLREEMGEDKRHDWILLGRSSVASDYEALNSLNQSVPSSFFGFDMLNSSLPDNPYLFNILHNQGNQRSDYYDSSKRSHFSKNWREKEIVGSDITILGGPTANLGTEYFNEFTDAFAIGGNVLIPFSNDTQLYELSNGSAFISTYKDLNGTSALVIWGVTAQDTYSVCQILSTHLLDEIRNMPKGVTTIILQFDYNFSPSQKEFYRIIWRVGTITVL